MTPIAPTAVILGLWAIGTVAALPFAWGWENDPWDEGGGRTVFEPGAFVLALGWPLIPPALAVGIPVALALLGMGWLAGRAWRWWQADWA